MNKYTLRINLEIKSNSDIDTIKRVENFIKELPRMEDVSYIGASLYNSTEKRMVQAEIK